MSRYPNNASSIASVFAKKKNRLPYLLYGGIGFIIIIYCLHYLSLTSTPAKPTPPTPNEILPHVDYLDSSQLMNSEELDRLLFQDAASTLTITPKYGHSIQQLDSMVHDILVPSTTVTALLQALPTATFYAQLDSVLQQSYSPSSIWLVCSPKDQPALQQHIQSLPEKDTIHLLLLPPPQQQEKNGHDDAWMRMALQSDADYVWILDSPALPGKAYLERLIKLSTTSDYKHTLLGTSAYGTQQQCMDTTAPGFVTMPAQHIDGLWLLARSWLTPDLFIEESRGKAISDYLNHIGITPIALPLTTTNQHQWHDTSLVASGLVCSAESTQQQKQDPTDDSSLVFLVDQWEQFEELVPLICHQSSSSSKRVIHVLPTATRSTLTQATMQDALLQHGVGCTSSAFNNGAFVVHTSAWLHGMYEAQSWHLAQHIMQRLASTLSSLEASVLIHTLRPSDPISDSVAAAASSSSATHPVTVITLPARDIQHVQWMMDLPMIALENWHKGKVQLVVTTDRNPYGLTRLLRSASKAHYMGDKVDLTIIMDQSSDRVTQQFVHDFSWHPHGEKQLRHRIVKMNRMPVFVESWYPRDSYDDYAILLHDDVDVSSLYYVWAKQALLHYRYSTATTNNSNNNNHPLGESVMGISLYTPRLVDAYVDGRQRFTPSVSTTTHPYLMQAVSNGGTLFFPEHWREFHDYVTARYADIKKKQLQTIEVPLARSANWTHSWRRYMDELMYLRGYVVMYPFVDQGQQSFSTHYLDIQHHDAASSASGGDGGDDDAIRALFQVPLVQDSNAIVDLVSSDVDELALFDLWGQPVDKHADLQERGWTLQRSVSACPPPSRLSLPVYDPADLLCPFARIVDVPVDQVLSDVLPTRVATLYVTNPAAPTAM